MKRLLDERPPIDRHPVLATIWFGMIVLALLVAYMLVGMLLLLSLFIVVRWTG